MKEVAMNYRLHVPLLHPFPFDFPELNDALVKARFAFELGLGVESLELDDGNRLGPTEIWKLIQERRAVLDGWRWLY
jgi:hypothetical protein